MAHRQLDVGPSLAAAHAAQRSVRQASRWFAGYLVVLGLFSAAWVLALETVGTSRPTRWVAASAGAIGLLGLSRWAEARAVQPPRARRTVLIATVAWFGAYLVVVGPLVRWVGGSSVAWWLPASLLMATPFFAAAAGARRPR